MSLARATDDPTLKKRYETMALDFLERGDADSQGKGASRQGPSRQVPSRRGPSKMAVIAESGPNRSEHE